MPSIFVAFGYKIYFWSNENNKPIHVHVCKGSPTKNATKFWITSTGGVLLASNGSRISKSDLNKLSKFISANYQIILQYWLSYFGHISYYC